MNDERLLNMKNLEIIITALSTDNLFVERRFLFQAEHSIGILLSFFLGQRTPS